MPDRGEFDGVCPRRAPQQLVLGDTLSGTSGDVDEQGLSRAVGHDALRATAEKRSLRMWRSIGGIRLSERNPPRDVTARYVDADQIDIEVLVLVAHHLRPVPAQRPGSRAELAQRCDAVVALESEVGDEAAGVRIERPLSGAGRAIEPDEARCRQIAHDLLAGSPIDIRSCLEAQGEQGSVVC
ncbi:hypothetical protein [Microbacterium esteraromaticum]|uniref:hypothetical protein n=1 Tax=Microbacterium esteraromaticum TaxID=57043 RepID=UPI0019D3268F|nr:hypothetical protein [Microbacterium esteraromaticum]MBN7792182.1 hypothetical protein [Microbacterium esteraromaticum]